MSLADLLIITPLDEEWRQVRSVLKNTVSEVRDGPNTYYLWTVKPKRNSPTQYLVAATSMGQMGIGATAAISRAALESWSPSYVSLLGIAGSLNPSEILLGDVVVSEEVFGYEIGDITNGQFEFRPTGHQVGALLLDRARALRNDPASYARWQSACRKAAEQDPALGPLPRAPEIRFGITASGNFVVKTAAFGKQLRERLHPKIVAVEMEAKGLFISVHQLEHNTQPLVIRGISDYADEEKANLEKQSKDAWRRFASGNAARFLKHLLSRNPFAPKSPRLSLNLTAKDPRLLLDHGLFLRQNGAVNLAFENLLGDQDALPEIELEISSSLGSKPVVPTHSMCLLQKEDYLRKITPHRSDTGSLLVSLPRSKSPQKADLLLSFSDSVERVTVSCRDEFGREAYAEWH